VIGGSVSSEVEGSEVEGSEVEGSEGEDEVTTEGVVVGRLVGT
jgi:hypothetical protein